MFWGLYVYLEQESRDLWCFREDGHSGIVWDSKIDT